MLQRTCWSHEKQLSNRAFEDCHQDHTGRETVRVCMQIKNRQFSADQALTFELRMRVFRSCQYFVTARMRQKNVKKYLCFED